MKFKKLTPPPKNNQKMTRAYVWMKISEYPPELPTALATDVRKNLRQFYVYLLQHMGSVKRGHIWAFFVLLRNQGTFFR